MGRRGRKGNPDGTPPRERRAAAAGGGRAWDNSGRTGREAMTSGKAGKKAGTVREWAGALMPVIPE